MHAPAQNGPTGVLPVLYTLAPAHNGAAGVLPVSHLGSPGGGVGLAETGAVRSEPRRDRPEQ